MSGFHPPDVARPKAGFFVVSYDIVDHRRRRKVHAAMEDFGTRVQYSVFECVLDEPTRQKMMEKLLRLVDPRVDSVRCYQLCRADVSKVRVVGRGSVTTRDAYHIV